MSLWAGLGGAKRNACVTLCTQDTILGICEQERITRARPAGVNSSGLPDEALDELLGRAGRARRDVTGFACAEGGLGPSDRDLLRLDHHFAHACASFLPSPFETARIIICDHESPQVSVWDGNGSTITRADYPWQGTGFAQLYSQCAEALGFHRSGREQRMEALARLDPSKHDSRVDTLFRLDGDRLEATADWQGRIEGLAAGGTPETLSGVAAALQSRIGDLLMDFVAKAAQDSPSRRLCLGGSLFYNSNLNSRVKRSGTFEEVFVPINPGNAGLALGSAMHVSQHRRGLVGPFLGPSYTAEETKATLDNCKLTYIWASEAETIGVAVKALMSGQLVAWFDGPMEWGPRALGARSILASPFSPYVLENLNRFLKQRDKWRGYAVSVSDDATHEHFAGPDRSPFMECDYIPNDRRRFAPILPGANAAIRVHTAGSDALPRFRNLLSAFGEASGVPMLVNTSFNSLREPIVCTPRDAVRVFFGTGVDMLVFPQFIIKK